MHVEFFGVPRERAGLSELQVNADTFGKLLESLGTRIPAFGSFISADHEGAHLHPAFIASS